MELYNTGDAIDGAHCQIVTRKEEWKGLQKDPIYGKNMTKYEMSRNSRAIIEKKHDISEEEIKKHKEKRNICFEVGDMVKGDSITVYVEQLRPLKEPNIINDSGRHEARQFFTKKRTLGIIKYPFAHIMEVTAQIAQGNIKLLKQ